MKNAREREERMSFNVLFADEEVPMGTNMEEKIIVADQEAAGQRLDVFLVSHLAFSRSYIKQLIDSGNILCGEIEVKSGKILKSGDVITMNIPLVKDIEIIPQNIPLDILYEDDDIAVINKQQGLTVHPGGGATDNTLVNALMFHLKGLSAINGSIRPGIVHRLDKDTSGVMVIAKNDSAHLDLARQLANREIKKIYYALVEGVVKNGSGTVETFIDRNPADRKLMSVSKTGRIAVSKYEVIERYKENTLLKFDILTGRTHQIRVHAKHIGHPVVGDKAYGYKKQKFNLNGQLLHAKSLTFTHPATKKTLTFSAPLPEHFDRILKILKNESSTKEEPDNAT